MVRNVDQDNISLSIIVDGKDLLDKYYYISIHTSKNVNKIPLARITLHDGDTSQQSFTGLDSKDFKIGSSIEIKVGYKENISSIFKGLITKFSISAYGETHSTLTVECRDAAYRTSLRRKNSFFQSTTDKDCIVAILDSYSDIKNTVESTLVKHEILLQHDISDWDFINLRAEANGKVVVVSDGEFQVKKIDTNAIESFEFIYGEDIIEIEMAMDCRNQFLNSVGTSWDSDDLSIKSVDSSHISEKSFGDLSYKDLSSATKQETFTFFHGGDSTSGEIKSFADARVEFSRLAKIQGKIVVEGNSALHVDTIIKITKGSLHFQGKCYVSGVNHIIVDGGWKTELIIGLSDIRYMHRYTDICSLPAYGVISPTSGLQIGKVKKIFGDPKDICRIFVRLPMFHSEEEGIWCRVSSAYASDEIGLFFFPEIDSEVIVGFIGDDPRSPIILGSMYGKKHKPPVPLDKDNSHKSITTKNKMKINFNEIDKIILVEIEGSEKRSISISDKDESITVINGSKCKLIMGKDGVDIISEGDINFSAQGSIKIDANRNIAIKAGNEISVQSQIVDIDGKSTASLTGAIKAEVKSSAETVIKGTMVLIN